MDKKFNEEQLMNMYDVLGDPPCMNCTKMDDDCVLNCFEIWDYELKLKEYFEENGRE